MSSTPVKMATASSVSVCGTAAGGAATGTGVEDGTELAGELGMDGAVQGRAGCGRGLDHAIRVPDLSLVKGWVGWIAHRKPRVGGVPQM